MRPEVESFHWCRQHKWVLLAFASICIRSLWLVGTQTQKALKVLLSSFLQPPGPMKVPLIQGSLCLLSSQGCYWSASRESQVQVQTTVAQDRIVAVSGLCGILASGTF